MHAFGAHGSRGIVGVLPQAIGFSQRPGDEEPRGGSIHQQPGTGFGQLHVEPVAIEVLAVLHGTQQVQRCRWNGGLDLARLGILREQRQHRADGRFGLLPRFRVEVPGGGERLLDALDVVGRRDDAAPRVQDVGVFGVDVVRFLDLRAFRGVHGVDAQSAAANEMDAGVASIRGFGGIERLQGQPGLPLAQLHFSLGGKDGGGVRILREGRVDAVRRLRDFAFMQESAHEASDQRCVARLLRQGLRIELFRVGVSAFAVGR